MEESTDLKITAKAQAIALRMLATRPRSIREIQDRLKSKGIPLQIIDDVVDKLTNYNYLNDYRFADMWVENRNNLKPMGRRRLKQELLGKGISKEIIAQSLQDITSDIEETLAMQLVEKKLRKNANQERSKLEGMLYRRGFNSSVVSRVLAMCGKISDLE